MSNEGAKQTKYMGKLSVIMAYVYSNEDKKS